MSVTRVLSDNSVERSRPINGSRNGALDLMFVAKPTAHGVLWKCVNLNIEAPAEV